MSRSKVTDRHAITNKDWLFTPATIESIRELGSVLEGIHNRLISEGYIIKDGIITKGHDSK